MGVLREIKYNRVAAKLNNYLSTLYVMEYKQPYELYYENEHGYDVICCFNDSSKIIIRQCLQFDNIDEDILFDVIKKFTKCENYTTVWIT